MLRAAADWQRLPPVPQVAGCLVGARADRRVRGPRRAAQAKEAGSKAKEAAQTRRGSVFGGRFAARPADPEPWSDLSPAERAAADDAAAAAAKPEA